MATHSSILAWRIPWTEEPGGLQSKRSKESDTAEPPSMRYVSEGYHHREWKKQHIHLHVTFRATVTIQSLSLVEVILHQCDLCLSTCC